MTNVQQLKTNKNFLKIVFSTIVFYRITTYLIILIWGKTNFWYTVTHDEWNHYQIGLVLILAGLIISKFKKLRSYRLWVIAIGWGMVIDEVSDIIKLLRLYQLPPNFRDSFADLILIALTYLAFSSIFLKLKNNPI